MLTNPATPPRSPRSEVELFYTRGAVGDVIAAINKKADEAERAVKGPVLFISSSFPLFERGICCWPGLISFSTPSD